LLKLLHDWHFGMDQVGMLFHWGRSGQLRVSHGQHRSDLSTPFEPVYQHKERNPLTRGEVRAVEIPLRPYGMYWKVCCGFSKSSPNPTDWNRKGMLWSSRCLEVRCFHFQFQVSGRYRAGILGFIPSTAWIEGRRARVLLSLASSLASFFNLSSDSMACLVASTSFIILQLQ
jgi:hypothetical protein